MKYSLLIDDIRDFHTHFTVRSKQAAIEFCQAVEGNTIQFDIVYLDFDLGDGTGLEVLKHLLTCEVSFDRLQIITMNPCGRQQLEGYLKDNGYHKDELGYWVK
jgi:CheY-like chemotaxis protein